MSEQIFCPICGKKLIVSPKECYWKDYYFFHDGHKITVKIYRQTVKSNCQIPTVVDENTDAPK